MCWCVSPISSFCGFPCFTHQSPFCLFVSWYLYYVRMILPHDNLIIFGFANDGFGSVVVVLYTCKMWLAIIGFDFASNIFACLDCVSNTLKRLCFLSILLSLRLSNPSVEQQFWEGLGCRKKHWSKQSACDQWSNLGMPLFLVVIFLFHTVTKTPEGVVVGLENFAWAPNSQKY